MEENKDNIVELTIEDLAFDGKSVAHMDGKVVFLNGGLPGEKVEAFIFRKKRKYNQGKVVRLLTRSDLRRETRCIHFGGCGGCTWQDLAYEQQLEFKSKQVKDCLERLGHLHDTEVREIIGSERQFFYRNKMEYSFHTSGDDSFTLGLHVRGRFDDIFDLDACHLQSEVSNRVVHWMRDYVKEKQIPVYDVKEHTGYMRFLMIRNTTRTEQTMVNIVTNYGEFPESEEMVQSLLKTVPEVTTVVHNENGQKSNIAVGEKETILHGTGIIEEELLGKRFRISSNSFFQTNSLQAETLYSTGFDMLEAEPDDRVLDLYCGTGTIGILLADRVAEVIGVELVEDAVRAAAENARLNGVDNIGFFQGHVKDFLRENQERTEAISAVIVDPPRAGMNPKALKQLISLNPHKLLYISCNPSTFARDAAKLVEAGYSLPAVQPVDMFPHTMHIELVGRFYRN